MRSKTPIAYYGGKQKMLRHILPLVPEHRLYTEAFCGGAALFWAKAPAKLSALNDVDGRLVNFYRVLKTRKDDLVTLVDATPHSEAEYRRAKAILKTGEADALTLAWSYWVCTQMSYSRKLYGGWAHAARVSETGKGDTEPQGTASKKLRLRGADDRLDACELWSRDALAVLKAKDRDYAFHYVDPPYVSSYQGHYAGYEREDWEGLLSVLSGLKGKFLLSSYDEPGLAEWTRERGLSRLTFDQPLRAKAGNKERKTEVLTANYDISGGRAEG